MNHLLQEEGERVCSTQELQNKIAALPSYIDQSKNEEDNICLEDDTKWSQQSQSSSQENKDDLFNGFQYLSTRDVGNKIKRMNSIDLELDFVENDNKNKLENKEFSNSSENDSNWNGNNNQRNRKRKRKDDNSLDSDRDNYQQSSISGKCKINGVRKRRKIVKNSNSMVSRRKRSNSMDKEMESCILDLTQICNGINNDNILIQMDIDKRKRIIDMETNSMITNSLDINVGSKYLNGNNITLSQEPQDLDSNSIQNEMESLDKDHETHFDEDFKEIGCVLSDIHGLENEGNNNGEINIEDHNDNEIVSFPMDIDETQRIIDMETNSMITNSLDINVGSKYLNENNIALSQEQQDLDSNSIQNEMEALNKDHQTHFDENVQETGSILNDIHGLENEGNNNEEINIEGNNDNEIVSFPMDIHQTQRIIDIETNSQSKNSLDINEENKYLNENIIILSQENKDLNSILIQNEPESFNNDHQNDLDEEVTENGCFLNDIDDSDLDEDDNGELNIDNNHDEKVLFPEEINDNPWDTLTENERNEINEFLEVSNPAPTISDDPDDISPFQNHKESSKEIIKYLKIRYCYE